MAPMSLMRRRLTTAAALAPLAGPWSARAADAFPSKPLTVIVPYPAGGSVDVGARILAEELEKIVQQRVVVESKPGGAFQIALQALAQRPADGHTILCTNTSFIAVELSLHQFKLRSSTLPVALWSQVDTFLTVSPNAPFQTLAQMVTWARANPGKLNFASAGGVGTLEHLKMVEFQKKYQFEATHIPYKGGPDSMIALAANEVQVYLAVTPLINQFRGKVRPLAVLGAKRNPLFPDVPALSEQEPGATAFAYWNGFSVADKTPPAMIKLLQDAVGQAMQTEQVSKRFAGFGMTPRFGTTADFNAQLDQDYKWIEKAVADAGPMGK